MSNTKAVLFLLYLLYILSSINCFKSIILKKYNKINNNKINNNNNNLFKLYNNKDTTTATNNIITIDSLIEQTKIYEDNAIETIKSSSSSKEIESLRVEFLGKKGKLTTLLQNMKNLSKEDKPKLGEVVNKAIQNVENIITITKDNITNKEYNELITQGSLGNTVQISSSGIFPIKEIGTRHPINLVMDLTCEIFRDIGYEIITDAESSPEIENEFYNFDALGMPFSHPARDMQDTLYINTTGVSNETLLLRTHTSAVQIREMEKRVPPFKICAPGRVYRKDDVDATHFPVFHQVEILAVDEFGKLTLPHLLGTVKYFLQKMFGPDIELKYRSSYFPFTEPSIEVDVYFKGKWLEVLGCGMVDPAVLEAVGYDSEKYSGFAAGFGVERFAMIMHNINDIRLFWDNNPEFLKQFPSTPYGIPGDNNQEKIADISRDK